MEAIKVIYIDGQTLEKPSELHYSNTHGPGLGPFRTLWALAFVYQGASL